MGLAHARPNYIITLAFGSWNALDHVACPDIMISAGLISVGRRVGGAWGRACRDLYKSTIGNSLLVKIYVATYVSNTALCC